MYHTFRIQLALDVIAGGAASRDVAPLIRAIPSVSTVPRRMQVQWFVHQEEQFVGFLPDFPDTDLVWEVLFDRESPFRDASYRCTLKTTAAEIRTPLVHSAEGEAIPVEHQGRFEYSIRVADEAGRTLSREKAVLIVR